MASAYDIKYISVVVCFIAFLINDIYGFVSWQRMKKDSIGIKGGHNDCSPLVFKNCVNTIKSGI